jgi:hypothetical protein
VHLPAATELAESAAILPALLCILLLATRQDTNLFICSRLSGRVHLPARRWLHELRIGDYGGASAALAQLADSQQHGDAEAARLRALQASSSACPAAAPASTAS